MEREDRNVVSGSDMTRRRRLHRLVKEDILEKILAGGDEIMIHAPFEKIGIIQGICTAIFFYYVFRFIARFFKQGFKDIEKDMHKRAIAKAKAKHDAMEAKCRQG